MLRGFVAALVLFVAVPTAAADERFPRPDGIEAQVQFWIRVYSEVTTGAGLIHDSREMHIVYEVFELPKGASHRTRERAIKKAKKKYSDSLKRLASGKRKNLSEIDKRVLAMFPEGVKNSTLRSASHRVRFQLGQADKFQDGIVRSGRWKQFIHDLLEARGAPVELGALPHVESSFNPKAVSHAGAAGLWQFTRSTGRRFMRVDHIVDERFDPYLASEAAARLLLENYRETESWPLAITAYNHGAAGMKRAVRRLRTRDIAEITRKYKSRSFGFASRNFYAEFLAAREVAENSEQFFGTLQLEPAEDLDIVVMDSFYAVATLENVFQIGSRRLRELNRGLRSPVWNGQKYVPKGYELRLPKRVDGQAQRVALAQIPASERILRQRPDRNYRVRRGDTLSNIAKRYGVTTSELVALNGLRSRHRIRAGQLLKLPSTHASPTVADVRSHSRNARRKLERPADGRYVVHRGDTLTYIAEQFGISVEDLAAANGLRNRNRISVGQTLKIPGDEPPKPVAARAEVETTPSVEAAPRVEATPPVLETAPVDLPYNPGRYGLLKGDMIEVNDAETLGHFADWLEVRASELRRINGMRYGRNLGIGERIRLDFSRVPRREFVDRRIAYHRDLQQEFFSTYQVAGTGDHVLKRGESLWQLSRGKYGVPVWLLREYNPDIDFRSLKPGMRLTIPHLKPRV